MIFASKVIISSRQNLSHRERRGCESVVVCTTDRSLMFQTLKLRGRWMGTPPRPGALPDRLL